VCISRLLLCLSVCDSASAAILSVCVVSLNENPAASGFPRCRLHVSMRTRSLLHIASHRSESTAMCVYFVYCYVYLCVYSASTAMFVCVCVWCVYYYVCPYVYSASTASLSVCVVSLNENPAASRFYLLSASREHTYSLSASRRQPS